MRFVALAVCISLIQLTPIQSREVPAFEDAALHAIHFIDENEGWATGDDGVVWHTIDGGASWERQPTGTRASLRSVQFLTPFIGWIAGREERPHGQDSLGVLLYTRDGGVKWSRAAIDSIPGLNRIRFVDANVGFVVGDGSDRFPSGVFRTMDGGRTWQNVPGPRYPAWLAADFQDNQTGALVGAWSRLTVLRQDKFGKADMEDSLGGRAIQDIRVVGQKAFAIGQGGLVLISRDSMGSRWGYANLPIPQEIRAAADFRALCCRGEHVWIAGRPGSIVLRSTDGGNRWEVLKTEQQMPLNALFFTSSQRGWAVGDFGAILHTQDGGKSWRVQRRGGQRAAVVLIHAHSTGLTTDTLALLGAEEGYLTVALRALCPEPDSAGPAAALEPHHHAAAVRMAGGTTGESLWQFPLGPHQAGVKPQRLIEIWNALHGDRAALEMLRQLVLAVRIWRPSIVLVDPPQGDETTGAAEALLAEAVQSAFAKAADASVFPEQISVLGLEPWRVSKVYCRWPSQAAAQIHHDLNRISAVLESSIRDYATPATGLLADSQLTLPYQRHYRLLQSRIEGAEAHRQLMQGIDLAPGGVARRRLTTIAGPSPEVENAIRQRRNLQALAETAGPELADPHRVLARLGPMAEKLPEQHAAPALFSIAGHFARIGQWHLARDVYSLIVARYPVHPLAVDAYRWLIRHNASSEIRRRHELRQFWVETEATIRSDSEQFNAITQTLFRKSGGSNPANQDDNGSFTKELVTETKGLLDQQKETRKWLDETLALGERLAALRPAYANDPSTQFCLQSARRQLGRFDQAATWYSEFHNNQLEGPWKDAAATEVWLTRRQGLPTKPLLYCKHTSGRPLLDGDFSDACWQDARAALLRDVGITTAKDCATEVRFAYDKDFLYIALQCKDAAGTQVPPIKVRPHDSNLLPFDRVSILFDLDRDYSSYFRLEVDQRGCVAEDCCGDKSWNPRWFVAVRSTKNAWCIEAAIPLLELTGDGISSGRAWACNVVRTIPGRGVQAWSQPVESQPPRSEPGMGIMLFLQEPSAAIRPAGLPGKNP